VVTKNRAECINQIFIEYERLTRASGLRLNADKTEKYDIYSRNIANPAVAIDVNYQGLNHTLRSQPRIKLNGLILERDKIEMQKSNYEIMLGKMTRHFMEWSKRSLSLLGKIQIIKTFGISQYLYTVAVIELAPEQWKTISKELHKFLWNKQYEGNAAPHRIRKSIMYTSILNGGFGMIELADIAKAARLKRYAYHLEQGIHPIADLQLALGGKENLKSRPVLDIDDVTNSAMMMLREYQLRAYGTIAIADADVDLVLHRQMLRCNIRNVVKATKVNSIEMTMLRRNRVTTVAEAITGADAYLNLVCRIAEDNLVPHLRRLKILYRDGNLPDLDDTAWLYEATQRRWLRVELLSSRQIRTLFNGESCLNETKLMALEVEQACSLYKKISRLCNVANKTKLLRLIHGDVYCGTRLYRFGLSNTDQCIRCFASETINHLLLECPYTQEVWERLGLMHRSIHDILRNNITQEELEVLAELISVLVFQKQV
jgi:hypothetical protein